MIKRIFSLITALIMVFALSVCAFAHEIPDYSRTSSITVKLTYNGKPVSGGSLAIYKVGNVAEDDGDYFFTYTEDFSECEIPLSEIGSSELPEKLAEIAKRKHLEKITQMIDSEGKAVFKDLEIGLYLVVQNWAAPGFSKISPFLVSVPAYENEVYVYDVDASPKTELEPVPYEPEDPPEEPDEPDEPDDKLPDTGLTSWPVPVMAASGTLLIFAGIILRRFERKNK